MSSEDWSIGIGLRRAVVHLVLWSIICAILWAAWLWLTTPVVNAILEAIPGRPRRLTTMIMAAQVAPFCWIFAKLLYDRMIERAASTASC